ncbi:MAG: murein biosynthesis integral membrane protein MurJ [Actinobacteria bacterium]|uniref:Unannotated protein n=1 Tax=freshwater metagenome TaxID=449393 RepID=A0A6J5ZNQ5_9ZZZZ|nr:murein biosynthesis integral membrane protein MurJ [Actinomycetota bacterium]
MAQRNFGNTSGMALGTLISRITGVVRDIVLVASIGTGIFSDTYSVANSLPNIIYILIAGGAINAVFIPVLVRRMNDDPDQGKAFSDRLITLVALVLGSVVIFSMALAPQITNLYTTSSWSQRDLYVASIFTLWCLPQIFFYGMYTLFSQVLNARNVFVAPMFAPIINNLIVIATSLTFLSLHQNQPTTTSVTNTQIGLLGFGTTLGVVVQAAILIPTLKRQGYSWRPRFDFRHTGLGQVGNLARWTIGFVFVNQISFLVLSNLATYANVITTNNNGISTGFTSYQKAQLMMMLPHSIITVSIITALLPRLSRQSHHHDLVRFGHEMANTARLVIGLIVPCAMLLFIAGPLLGQLMYGHGASSQGQGQAVGQIASMFALGLPAFSMFYLLLRSYYAQENTKTPFFLNLAFNIGHLAIGVSLFAAVDTRFKVAALGFGYSAAYTATALVTWKLVSRRFSEMTQARIPVHVFKSIAASAAAAAVSWAVHVTLSMVMKSASIPSLIIDLAVMGLVFVATYLIVAQNMRVISISDLRGFRRVT